MTKPKRDHHEQAILHEMGTCVHFNGIQHDSCKADVVYHDLLGTGPGWAARLPCIQSDGASITCPKSSFPTRQQAEEAVTRHEARTAKVCQAVNATHAHARQHGLGKGHGGMGSMPCPTGCGGTLRYSVAGCNGHIHASCSTAGCVSWME